MRKLIVFCTLVSCILASQGCSPDTSTTKPSGEISPRPSATSPDGKTSSSPSSTTGFEAQ